MNTDRPVVSLVWNLIRGGTEGQCARVAMGLARSGQRHRVAVFRKEGFFLDSVESACGPVYHLDIRRMFAWQTLQSVRRFSDWLRKQRASVLHTWDADAAIFGSIAARWAGIPLITSRRDLGEIYPIHKVWLLDRADAQSVRVVANAVAIARRFVERGLPEDRVVVLPNMLDLAEFDRLREQPSASEIPAGPAIVSVARLDPEKDVGLLLRALPTVRKAIPAVRAYIAGDGVERTALEALARDLGISEIVTFLGDVSVIPSLLSKMTVGVLTPSRNEGLSNTLLEYMAAGLPWVATDCGGNRELSAEGRAGQVIAAGDAPQLAAALVDYLCDSELRARSGAEGRSRIERLHAPGAVCQAFARLYERVIRESA